MALVADEILEKINSLIVIVNQQGQVEYVSPSAKRILGFDTEKLKGNGWFELTRDNEKDRARVKNLVLEQLNQTSLLETIPTERLLKTANGGQKWILWNMSKGPQNTLVGIGHDITDRKKAELQLKRKHEKLQQRNNQMLESIEYASRLQQAILPDVTQIKNCFNDAFVLYLPKDVVSGDYYFFHKHKQKVFVAAVDCTGHGVPGALLSIIAHSIFKEVIVKRQMEEPSEILYALDIELQAALNKNNIEKENHEGMDVALGVFDFEKNELLYSGAFRPAILIRNGSVIDLEANRFPIGFYAEIEKKFSTQKIALQQNDVFYFFSDGFNDQFGGEDNRKFTKKRFKELLLSAQDMDLDEQESFLQYCFNNWKQSTAQTDDVLVIGVKV